MQSVINNELHVIFEQFGIKSPRKFSKIALKKYAITSAYNISTSAYLTMTSVLCFIL